MKIRSFIVCMSPSTFFQHVMQTLLMRSTFNLDILLYVISFNSFKKENSPEKKNKNVSRVAMTRKKKEEKNTKMLNRLNR